LVDEIKALKLYVELEQLRFEDKLVYHFTVDENISVETTYIPSMLIQPYIENAIKHGLLHKKNNWLLNITFSGQQEKLIVIIDDNGIGRKRSAELNTTKSKHQSFASVANEKRLSILNRGLNESIGLNIIDKVDENNQPIGTTVQLIIPIEKQ
jgi:LytS/YehU family sensor histidine kinase